MRVSIRVKDSHVHIVVNRNGKRRQYSTGLKISTIPEKNKEIMELAERIRAKKELEFVAKLNGIEIESAERRQSLYQYAEKYSLEHGSQIYKALPYLKKFGADDIGIVEITPKWFENFQNHMMHDSGLSPATQEKYTGVLRQILKKAVRDGFLTSEPSSGIRHIKIPETIKEYLTASEVRKLVETPYERKSKQRSITMPIELQQEIRRGFLFGCCTGLRVSDIKQLKWGHIDIENMRIAKQQQKTKSLVYIPLKKEAWLLINDNKLHDVEELLFPKLAVTNTTTNRYLHGWAKEAGLQKHVTWHTARHTDATLLLEYGADLYTVQKLLGHSKITTTAKYAKVSDKKQRAAVDRLPEFGITAKG